MHECLDNNTGSYVVEAWLYTEIEKMKRFSVAAIRSSTHRNLFKTQTGLIGTGPKALREDDVLAILYGGNVPFVLRSCADGYQMIGPGYMYGMMDGEAITTRGEKGLLEKDFLLI